MTTGSLKRTALPLVGLSLLIAYCQGSAQAPRRAGALASPSGTPTGAVARSSQLPRRCSYSPWQETSFPADLSLQLAAGDRRSIPAGYTDFEAFTPGGKPLERSWCTTKDPLVGWYRYDDASGRAFVTYNGKVVVAHRAARFDVWQPIPEPKVHQAGTR